MRTMEECGKNRLVSESLKSLQQPAEKMHTPTPAGPLLAKIHQRFLDMVLALFKT